MTATINASTTGGVVVTSDTSGSLALQSNGTTVATIQSTGVAFANSSLQNYAAGLGTGGQTWQSPTRAIGTTYTNSTGYPIQVAVTYSNTTGNTIQGLIINGVTVYAGAVDVANNPGAFSLIVPNGATYIFASNGGTATLVTWVELR